MNLKFSEKHECKCLKDTELRVLQKFQVDKIIAKDFSKNIWELNIFFIPSVRHKHETEKLALNQLCIQRDLTLNPWEECPTSSRLQAEQS